MGPGGLVGSRGLCSCHRRVPESSVPGPTAAQLSSSLWGFPGSFSLGAGLRALGRGTEPLRPERGAEMLRRIPKSQRDLWGSGWAIF